MTNRATERPLGFSTGSLTRGDFRTALAMLAPYRLPAIELSALREDELIRLLDALSGLELDGYQHLSIHLPSKLEKGSEAELVETVLSTGLGRSYALIVHPDLVGEPSVWRSLGAALCLENMDKRKPVGQSADQLNELFEALPEARLCFDIGHARQVDPTMLEARRILKQHGHRLAQVHLSEVNSASGHERINRLAMRAFARVAHRIPASTPIILEIPVEARDIRAELEMAQLALPLVRPSAGALVPLIPDRDCNAPAIRRKAWP